MTTEYYRHRWLVECDGERSSHRARARARAVAAQVNGHPCNENIRLFGPYANADGIARIIDLGSPDSDRIRAGKKNTYVFHPDMDE